MNRLDKIYLFHEILKNSRYPVPREAIQERLECSRIFSMGKRTSAPDSFQTAAQAVLNRERLNIVYHGRERDAPTEREISPQRLVHYRDNWYLDAWCHLRKGLRSFSVDRIVRAVISGKKAKEIPDARLDAHFAAAYGIFAGKAKGTAHLLFTGDAARWVENTQWHPDQSAQHTEKGYELKIPYSDLRELVPDILRFLPHVRVLSPASLREEVRKRVEKALEEMATGK